MALKYSQRSLNIEKTCRKESVLECYDVRKAQPALDGFEDRSRVPEAKECECFLEAEKHTEMDSLLEAPERNATLLRP